MTQKTEQKRQFKLLLNPMMVKRLEKAANRYGRRSGQAVAEELLALYLPRWEETAQEARVRARQAEPAVAGA